MFRSLLVAVIGLGGLLAVAGAEPLGTDFTYQGDLRFQGAPASGEFDFRFSLYADADSFMLVAEPLEIQDLTVSEGIFTTTLDFGPGPFAGDVLWLEISVREGSSTSGYAQLLPRQRLTAAPYALHAEMVAADAISSMEIADGSITSADLAGNSVTSANIAPGVVDGTHVNSSQVQLRVSEACRAGTSIRSIAVDGTVTCEADDDTTYDGSTFALSNQGCATGQLVKAIASEGTVTCVTDRGLTSVTSRDIVDGTIAAVDIGPGAVGSSEVDSSEVQLRISGNCAVGRSIRSVAADGTVTCGFGQFYLDRPTFALLVDSGSGSFSSAGSHNRIAIGADGLPIISYSENQGLRMAKCDDPACSGGGETLSIVDSGTVGLFNSIAVGPDGLPVISYRDQDAEALKVVKCNDAMCSGGNETITIVDDPVNNVGYYTDIAIGADGLPVISYYDLANGALKVAKCNDAACSGGDEAINTVDDTAEFVGEHTSLAIGRDGLPIISYKDRSNSTVKVAKCHDAACSGGNEAITAFGETGFGFKGISMTMGADGLPIISYTTGNDRTLKVIKCNDAACSSGDETITVVDATGITGQSGVAIGSDGLPVISYLQSGALKVAKCNDSSCSGGDEALTVVYQPPPQASFETSIAIGPDGLPVISYFVNSETALYVSKCGNLVCAP